jgi:hypothetical protein
MKVFFEVAQPCRRLGGGGRRLVVLREGICVHFIRPGRCGVANRWNQVGGGGGGD